MSDLRLQPGLEIPNYNEQGFGFQVSGVRSEKDKNCAKHPYRINLTPGKVIWPKLESSPENVEETLKEKTWHLKN